MAGKDKLIPAVAGRLTLIISPGGEDDSAVKKEPVSSGWFLGNRGWLHAGVTPKEEEMEKDYLYRCDQCGAEKPAKHTDPPSWQAKYCNECKKTTMHYKVSK